MRGQGSGPPLPKPERMRQFGKRQDPLLLLRARESALESLLKIAKLDDDIYNDYIELLNYNGGFLRTDVTNQLKAGVGK